MRLTTKFRLIYLAPVLALIALMGWALASPIGASPDDDYHLVSIWCGDGIRTGVCEAGGSAGQRIVPEALKEASVCYAHRPNISAACQESTFTLDPKVTATTSRGNFFGEYPPVYYAVMGVFVTPNILGSVVLMRMLNALLFVGLTTALFALLPSMRRPGLIWAWLITTIPLGIFLIASNNPSSWAITGVGTAWIALLAYFETHGRRRIGLAVVFVIGTMMAAGARSDGAIYAGLGIAVATVLAFKSQRRFYFAAILPIVMGIVALLIFLAAGQSSTGLQGFGNPPAPVSESGAAAQSATADPLSMIVTNLFNVPSLWAGALGSWGLGWLDTAMPAIVTFGAIACFVGVVFAGLSVMWWRKALVLGGVALVLWLLPAWVLFKGGNSVGQEVQPRYLMPLIVLFAGIVVLNFGARVIQLTLIQRVLVCGTLSVAQIIALYVNMRRYIQGDGGGGWNLDVHPAWWWGIVLSPMFVLVTSSVAFSAMVWILVREATRQRVVGALTSTVEG